MCPSIFSSGYLSIYLPTSEFNYLCVVLSHYLSIHLSIFLSSFLSIFLPFFLSIYPSICLSICLSIYLSMHLPIVAHLFVLFICLSICLPIYSICLLPSLKTNLFSRLPEFLVVFDLNDTQHEAIPGDFLNFSTWQLTTSKTKQFC